MVSTEIDLHNISPHLLPSCPSHISSLNPNSYPLHTEVDRIFFYHYIFNVLLWVWFFLPVAYIWYQEDKSVFTGKSCKRGSSLWDANCWKPCKEQQATLELKAQTGSQKNHAKRAWRDRSLRICVLLTFCCTPEHNLWIVWKL